MVGRLPHRVVEISRARTDSPVQLRRNDSGFSHHHLGIGQAVRGLLVIAGGEKEVHQDYMVGFFLAGGWIRLRRRGLGPPPLRTVSGLAPGHAVRPGGPGAGLDA